MPALTRARDAAERLIASLEQKRVAAGSTKAGDAQRRRSRPTPPFEHLFDVLVNDFGIEDLRDASTRELAVEAVISSSQDSAAASGRAAAAPPSSVETLPQFRAWVREQSMPLTQPIVRYGDALSKKRVGVRRRRIVELCRAVSVLFDAHFNPPLRLLAAMHVTTLNFEHRTGARTFVTLDQTRYAFNDARGYRPTHVRPRVRELVDNRPKLSGDAYTFADASKYFVNATHIADVFIDPNRNGGPRRRYVLKETLRPYAAVVHTGSPMTPVVGVENRVAFLKDLKGAHIQAITTRSDADAYVLIFTWRPNQSFIVKLDDAFRVRSACGIFPHARLDLRALANVFGHTSTAQKTAGPLFTFMAAARRRCDERTFGARAARVSE